MGLLRSQFDDWYDYANPFAYLGDAAGKVVADGWTAAMLGLWNAGLFVLRSILLLIDGFMTPYLGQDGPAKEVYEVTFWLALSLAVMLVLVQLGMAGVRRDGASLARVLIGAGQFLGVWMVWLVFAGATVVAAGGLTQGLLKMLLSIDYWAQFDPFGAFSTQDITDGTVATVLGLLGLFMWLTAIAMLVVWLFRAAALLVLTAATPISAAGLVCEAGRAWFWKSLRWFLATAFTPVIMVLILGLGVKITTGVVSQPSTGMRSDIGTAIVGVVLLCMSSVAPLALFRLLAFVDPGTTSGASMRAGLDAQGGLSRVAQRLLSGGDRGETGNAASTGDSLGRSSGEASAESTGMSRMGGAGTGSSGGGAKTGTGAGTGGTAGGAGGGGAGGGGAGGGGAGSASAGGAAGGVGAGVLGAAAVVAGGYLAGASAVRKVGTTGTSLMGDVANQSGMGHEAYQPDFTGYPTSGSGRGRREDGRVPVSERASDSEDDAASSDEG